MTRQSRVWRAAVALFTVVNVAGAVYAVLHGELFHAAVHVALLVATYVVWRGVSRSRRFEPPHARSADERLDRLQQSLDAIALDVERIGEAQRFAIKVVSERVGSSPPKSS